MPQQTSPLSQLASAVQVWIASAGATQSMSGTLTLTFAQTSPFFTSQLESPLQCLGHDLAGKHALPASPKSQHRSPWLVSQSLSLPQVFSHVSWQ
jgi:hypothetical protein